MLKNGWVRLTFIGWGTWILWSLSQHEWDAWGICGGSDGPFHALCLLWEFYLPPVVALGLWWAARGFGKGKIDQALSSPKAPAVGLLLLSAGLVALGAGVQGVARQLASVESAVEEKVEHASGATEEAMKEKLQEVETRLTDKIEEVESEVRDVALR